jgi:hypothetical protein
METRKPLISTQKNSDSFNEMSAIFQEQNNNFEFSQSDFSLTLDKEKENFTNSN